jgi:hypothetical protein
MFPIFSKDMENQLRQQVGVNRHLVDVSFATMISTMCTLASAYNAHRWPIGVGSNGFCEDRVSKCLRWTARAELGGRETRLEDVITSYHLCQVLLFTGKHEAAWFRLQEALTLGEVVGILDWRSCTHLEAYDRELRLRTYWVL